MKKKYLWSVTPIIISEKKMLHLCDKNTDWKHVKWTDYSWVFMALYVLASYKSITIVCQVLETVNA